MTLMVIGGYFHEMIDVLNLMLVYNIHILINSGLQIGALCIDYEALSN